MRIELMIPYEPVRISRTSESVDLWTNETLARMLVIIVKWSNETPEGLLRVVEGMITSLDFKSPCVELKKRIHQHCGRKKGINVWLLSSFVVHVDDIYVAKFIGIDVMWLSE